MANINDDASDWFASQNEQIQDYEAPAPPPTDGMGYEEAEVIEDPDRPWGDVPTVTDEDVRNVENMRLMQKPTAELIVGVMDVILPIVICLLIKGTDKDDVKLEPDERETLVGAFATYLGDKNVQASPGVVLIVTIVTIYGGKIFSAMAGKQRRDELAQLRAMVEEQQNTIEQLTTQLKMARQQNGSD